MTCARALLLVVCFVPLAYAQPVPRSPVDALSTGDLVITEIHFAPPVSQNEFIEVLNASDRLVDLQHVQYADGNLNADPVTLAPTLLAPGERVVLVRSPPDFERAFPDVPYLAPDGWEALNNGGDLVLLTAGSTVLDAVEYDGRWATINGASLERIDPKAPAEAFNFASSTAAAGATPGRQNSVHAPDREPPRAIFADVVADCAVEVVFSEPLRATSLAGARVVWASGTGADEGAAVTSVATDAVRIHHGLAAPPPWVRVTGVRDLTGNETDGAQTPIALRPRTGDVVVNELLPAPRADAFDARPDQPEYVEVYNRSRSLLSLRGFALSDRPREDGTADTIAAGRLVALPPGGYAVVFAGAEVFDTDADPATASLLARAFPDAPLTGKNVVLLPVDARSLGLRNRGGVVRLHRSDGLLLDSLTYDARWHADALDDPTGTSLERISTSASGASPDNWRSSTARYGGTPAAANAAALSAAPRASKQSGVTVAPSPFSAERDGATRIRYVLRAEASVVRVRIFDATGRPVRTLAGARLSGREGEIVWNGRGDDGERLRVGMYVVLVDAVDARGGTAERHKQTVVLARPFR